MAYSPTSRTLAVNHFYGTGPLVEGRMDPIIDPGVASAHVHSVQGGSNFSLMMTDDQALDSVCTSSLIKNDKSNYWTPKLYFQFENGSFIDVPMFYMNVYYFFEATTDKITAFQPGHRMVVGNPYLRTPPATGGQSILDLSQGTPQPVQWTCPRLPTSTANPLYPVDSDGLHGVGIQDPNNSGAGVGFPDQKCDGYASPLRADIHFPSCYNPAEGLDAYRTNMEFPNDGNCLEDWEHKPHLFYEVYWNTPLFAEYWTENQGKQPFVLSMGDPTGYGLHADFIAGWDVTTLQHIIDNCDAGDAGIDKCPGLIGGLNDPSSSCNIPSAIDEGITGIMEILPGNNAVGEWGVPAMPPTAGGSTSVNLAPSLATSSILAGSTLTTLNTPNALVEPEGPASTSSTSSWSYYGCYSDTTSGPRVLAGIAFANVGQNAVTNTKCTTYCEAAGFIIAGTKNGGQCFCGNKLVGSSAIDESKCGMPCNGNSTQTCGGSLALSVYSTSAAML